MSAVVLRRVQIGLLAVGIIVTVMMAAMVAGCYRDDAAIDAHKGTAIADVMSAGAFTSTVRFYTPSGDLRSPRLGVLYPTRLTEGQRISVDYSTEDPNLVRVAGRDASLSLIPAASVAGLTWVGVLATMIGLAYATRRRARTSTTEQPGTDPATRGEIESTDAGSQPPGTEQPGSDTPDSQSSVSNSR